jgi:hypothetical protein
VTRRAVEKGEDMNILRTHHASADTVRWCGGGDEIRENATAEKRSMDESASMWSRKGATLSDKSARQEFGLSQGEIIAAIRAGKLQFRESNMHGNPWYRLLRHEVESLVRDKSGLDHLQQKKLQKELADINKEARKLTTRLKAIELRRAELLKELDG